jgi:separase
MKVINHLYTFRFFWLTELVYVWVCVDLAHEYVKLGRLEKASSVYNSTLPMVQNASIPISEEARVFFYLRFAESLAMAGSILQG